MSSVTINIDTFNNPQWGSWDNAGQQKKAYLTLEPEEGDWILQVSSDKGSEENRAPNLIDRVNALIEQNIPFKVQSEGRQFKLLDGRTVTWENSDAQTRREIYQEVVWPRLSAFSGQTHAGKYFRDHEIRNLIAEIQHEAPSEQVAMGKTGKLLKLLQRKETDMSADLCFCAARVQCLVGALLTLVFITVLPFITIYQGFTDDKWPNLGWRVLDVSVAVIISPIILTIKTIQYLTGAIIHPAIALSSNNEY